MKKLLLLAGLILMIVSCSTNKQVNFDQLQDRGGLFYLANDKEPFTGDVISYQGGRPITEGHMRNGLRNGLWIYYFPNGQKQAEGNFVDGLKEGTWNYWKDNGEQDIVELYKMGNKLGNSQENPNDSISKEDPSKPLATSGADASATQTQQQQAPAKTTVTPKPKPVVWERLRGGPVKLLDGVPYTGSVVKYFKTGGLELQGHFTNGHRSGKWTFYFPNGNVKDVKYY